jgi:hypothetical protein
MKLTILLLTFLLSQVAFAETAEEVKYRILGDSSEPGLAYQVGQQHNFNSVDDRRNIDVKINLSSYPSSLNNQIFSELKAAHYPVTLKEKTLTFNWTQYYCSNYDKTLPDEIAYLKKHVAQRAMERIANNLYTNCPIMDDLNYDLQVQIFGKELDRSDYLIGYQKELMRKDLSLKDIEDIHVRLNQIAQNKCDLQFKSFWTMILGNIKFNENMLVKTYDNSQTKKAPEYNYDKFCKAPPAQLVYKK